MPDGVKHLSDLEYAKIDGRSLTLDLYLPEKTSGKLPVVVWVHGGGWQSGNKNSTPAVYLTAHGYAVASISYRLSGVAKFPTQIQDCKAAVRWLRANAEKYNLDPARFGAWGASAGGHLVALLGATKNIAEFENAHGNREYDSHIQAVVDFYGPTDFLQMDAHAPADSRIIHDAPDSPESRLIGAPIQENKDKVQKANPITYITKNAPPFLIVHGDKDPAVPLHQSQLLHAALTKAGVSSNLWIIPGAGHGFGAEHRDTLERRILAFFDIHLKDSSTETLPPDGLRQFVYKKTSQGDLQVSVHFPDGWKKTDKRPAIVFFFGGGWKQGTIEQFRYQADYFAKRGMVTLRADYRVESRHKTTPMEAVEDAKSAVRWLRANAETLGVDPNRLVAAGGSAGGHLAACAGLTQTDDATLEDSRISSRPNVLILFNPVLRLENEPFALSEEKKRAISPVQHIRPNAPPILLFFGTEDRLLAQGKEFIQKSKSIQNSCELFVASGQTHGFFNRSPWREATLRQADRFLIALGYLSGEPTVELNEKVELIRD